jgi:hypothetical protein
MVAIFDTTLLLSLHLQAEKEGGTFMTTALKYIKGLVWLLHRIMGESRGRG